MEPLAQAALPGVTGVGLHREIELHLGRAIVRGDFASGSALPTESDLIRQFGVSRAVIRAALRGLAQRGMVDMRQGRRTTVLPAGSWDVLDPVVLSAHRDEGRIRPLVRDALQIRCWLEPESAAEATRRKDDELVEDLAQLVARMEDSLSDHSAFLVADAAFHERIARAADNRVLLRIIEAMRELTYIGREFTSRTPATLKSGLEDHLSIHRAIAGGDPRTARHTMARHMSDTLHHLPDTATARPARPGAGL